MGSPYTYDDKEGEYCPSCYGRPGDVSEKTHEALKAQLAAAEERARDMEVMLRAALDRPARLGACAGGGWWAVDPSLGASHGWPVPDDGTGLPLLTDEARAALRRAMEKK